MLKIGSVICTISHEMYIEYISFFWPLVVATHDCKRLA